MEQGGVVYVLWSDVISPDSKTAHFNRVVDRIKSDPKCIEMLGDPKKISAHGEETNNKWRRARPIAYVLFANWNSCNGLTGAARLSTLIQEVTSTCWCTFTYVIERPLAPPCAKSLLGRRTPQQGCGIPAHGQNAKLWRVRVQISLPRCTGPPEILPGECGYCDRHRKERGQVPRDQLGLIVR